MTHLTEMRASIAAGWSRLIAVVRRLDRQLLVVFTLAPLLVVVQYKLGSRDFFRNVLSAEVSETWRGLFEWGWWFVCQGVTGFVVPVLVLGVFFRQTPLQMGLGPGDWRFATKIAAVYLPLVAAATWFLSSDPGFRAAYPHYLPAAYDWRLFLVYEGLFIFYWIGWEYLWRGFMLFGARHALGYMAIFVQAVPFTTLHVNKPFLEGLLALPGALALGALVWRCRSFWVAVPIHAAQMLILDFWCAGRLRTGIQAVDLRGLVTLVRMVLAGEGAAP